MPGRLQTSGHLKKSIKMEPNITTIEEKRNALREMSKAVAPLVQAEQFGSINEAVIETFYRNATDSEFKTFNQWKADGYSIKKGAKAFLVWGKPKRVQDNEQAEAKGKDAPPADEEKKPDFFPLAFLFSNAQVEMKGERQNA